MCGFVGVHGSNGSTLKMLREIIHRGPDSQQILRKGNTEFGFCRLAIVDIEGGSQPFLSENESTMCVVNGEIYNHLELREQLHGLGHSFKSRSDGEVVLHGYEEWGEGVFHKLKGMFAVAIYDQTEDKLVLARDPMGKKPLYWSRKSDEILFGSELKGLIPRLGSLNIRHESVASYLISDSVPTPYSIYEGVYKVEPGTSISFMDRRKDGLKKSFWNPDVQRSTERLNDPREVTNNLEKALRASVGRRLMADVPIGVFLSSGVDSMAVAAIAADISDLSLNSYTLSFVDRSFDESEISRNFADYLGFNHTEIKVTNDEILRQLEVSVDIFDEPLNDPASVVQLLLSEVAAKDVKVALTGDGGDELFWGYSHVAAHNLVQGLPQPALKVTESLGRLSKYLPDRGGYFSLGFKAQRFARAAGQADWVERDIRWRGAFDIETAEDLIQDDKLVKAEIERFRRIAKQADWAQNYLDEWSWLYLRTYLLDTVLVKVDRATMAYGVEARSPLLDTDFVNFALSLPPEYKTGRWAKKKLMRTVLGKYSPNISPVKSKHGMGVPTSQLLAGPLKEMVYDLLSPTFVDNQALFSSGEISKLLVEFYDLRLDRRKEIWGLLIFQLWYCKWARVG